MALHVLSALLTGAMAREWFNDTRAGLLAGLLVDAHRAGELTDVELVPGPDVQTPEQIRTFVRDEAWGHHASCSCRIGADSDPMAVVDSEFRVRGVRDLRVVDASVFPRIPGFFIVSAIYMVSEKASEVILATVR